MSPNSGKIDKQFVPSTLELTKVNTSVNGGYGGKGPQGPAPPIAAQRNTFLD